MAEEQIQLMKKAAMQMQHRRMTKKALLRRSVFLFLGAVLMSIGLEIFLVPNRIIDGGITGISIILSYLTNIQVGIFLTLLNLPFLFIGYKLIGKTFALSTLFAILVMSTGTYLLHPVKELTHDPLLAAVFGGIILGIGVGMVFVSGDHSMGQKLLRFSCPKKFHSP